MKPADLGDSDDAPGRDRLDVAAAWTVVTETLMRPREGVVRDVPAKQPTQVGLAEHDDEIEAFSPDGADDAFGEGILPGRARGDDDLANTHALHAALEVSGVD